MSTRRNLIRRFGDRALRAPLRRRRLREYAARAQAPGAGPVQPWGLPPLPAGVGPVEKFADVSGTAAGSASLKAELVPRPRAIYGLWRSAAAGFHHLTPDGKPVPVCQLQPAARTRPDLSAAEGTRWLNGKLYLTTRHRGILVYDPQSKELKTLVYTYLNQLFKGPNDLDFDAEGNLFFTDPWGTGPGPGMADRAGAVYQYSRDGVLRKLMDSGMFPNGIAVSPQNTVLAIGNSRAGRMWYATFANGPTMGCPQCTKDPLHLTFAGIKAGTYVPGNGGCDGIHYDVKGQSSG